MNRTPALLALALLLAVIGALRLVGSDSMLPDCRDPDSLYVHQGMRFEMGARPGSREISDLYPYFLGALLTSLPGELNQVAPEDASLEEHRRAAGIGHQRGRQQSAVLSLFGMVALFLIGRMWWGPGWGLLAAAFGGTSLLWVLMSHQARPHATLTAFLACSVYVALRMARDPSLKNVCLASLVGGITLATLHSGLLAAAPIGMAALAVWKREGHSALKRMPLLLIGPALALWLCYPFLFQDKLMAGRDFPDQVWTGAGFGYMARSLWAYEPVLVILGSIGGIVWAVRTLRGTRERRVDDLVVLIYTVPYMVAIGMYYSTFHRFTLPLIPVLCLMAVAGVRALCRPVSKDRPLIPVAVSLLALAFPFLSAWKLASLWTKETSIDLATQWVVENLDPDEHALLVSHGVCLGMPQDHESIHMTLRSWRMPWQIYQYDRGESLPGTTWRMFNVYTKKYAREGRREITTDMVRDQIRHKKVTHAAIIVPGRGPRAERDGTRDAILELNGKLLTTIELYSSEDLKGDLGSRDMLGYEPLRFVWTSEGRGPVIEIYEVPMPEKRRPAKR